MQNISNQQAGSSQLTEMATSLGVRSAAEAVSRSAPFSLSVRARIHSPPGSTRMLRKWSSGICGGSPAGPAGTGKTYLAVAMALSALRSELVRKIVLVRPAVEAGESLGYLPGDLHAKINPYLRPLLDALYTMIDYDAVKQLMEKDVIEVVPLAYMRGRTLEDAFIILDEAQNTTISQMKMFLTRMGEGSKIVASGDITQIDLPRKASSGLIDAVSRLKNIKGIGQVTLTANDIVRHRLVQEIVEAYETASVPSRSTSSRRK